MPIAKRPDDVAPTVPAIAQELQGVSNPGLSYFNCLCGRCRVGENTSFDDFALDTGLRAAQDMLVAVECAIPVDDLGANVALQSTRGLIDSARMTLCMQRRDARAGEE